MKNGSFSALTLFYWDFFLFGPAEIAKDKVFSRGLCTSACVVEWTPPSRPPALRNRATARPNDFPLNRWDVLRAVDWHLQWNPEQRAQLVYHSLNDALRIYRYRSWNLFLLFLVALAIFIRICARASTHTRNAYLVAVQIESQLIMKYYRCAAPFQCSRISRWCDT